jgi:hypothetical protein
MSIFSTIAKFFTGNAGEKVTDLADKAFYTDQEKAGDAADDLTKARQFEPGEKWNTAIDKWHRAIRPTLATWATLVLIGIAPPPKHWDAIPEPVWQLILVIVSFYFGGRALLKDLPATIKAMRK